MVIINQNNDQYKGTIILKKKDKKGIKATFQNDMCHVVSFLIAFNIQWNMVVKVKILHL